MEISFRLKCKDNEELEILPEFIDWIVNLIKRDLYNSLIKSKVKMREKYLLDSKIIKWLPRRKPKSINMVKLVDTIISSIRAYRYKDLYTIKVDSDKRMKNTYNTLSQVARLIEYGNQKFPPLFFFNRIFSRYRNVMNKYWEHFIIKTLHRPRISDLILIR